MSGTVAVRDLSTRPLLSGSLAYAGRRIGALGTQTISQEPDGAWYVVGGAGVLLKAEIARVLDQTQAPQARAAGIVDWRAIDVRWHYYSRRRNLWDTATVYLIDFDAVESLDPATGRPIFVLSDVRARVVGRLDSDTEPEEEERAWLPKTPPPPQRPP